MLIIDAIKQHVQKTGNSIPEWANYVTQNALKRIQYWEQKPKSVDLFGEFWDDNFTNNETTDFDVSYLCEDWHISLEITDEVRDFIDQTKKSMELYNVAQDLNHILSVYGVLDYFHSHELPEGPVNHKHLIDAIRCRGFEWDNTPQGLSFWSDINKDWLTTVKAANWTNLHTRHIWKMSKVLYEENFEESSEIENNPYRKPFTNRMRDYWSMDVYDVCEAFDLDPITSHGVKKLLVSGGRNGGKSEIQDLKEAIWSIEERIKELENN